MSKRPIEAVVFDMDGVLIDSEPIWRAVEREVLATVGIEATEEQLIETMGVPIDEVVERWYRRHPWDGPSREEIAEAIVDGVARAIERDEPLREGAVAAVDYFDGLGLRLALASSSPMRLIEVGTALGGLDDRFEVIHSAEDEERGKPDPAVYLTTAKRLGVPPARCLALEDSVSGVRAAKAAEMVCIAIPETPDARPDFRHADLVLDSPTEIGDAIWDATGTYPASGTG